MKLKFLIAGGTICKQYNELTGKLEFQKSFVPEMLLRGRCQLAYSTEVLMLKDSLDMTAADREVILTACQASEESRIIISHGTDSMVETASVLGQGLSDKTVVLVGAMIPYSIRNSDALFNLGCAVTAVQLLHKGVYVVMNGEVFAWNHVQKNHDLGVFQYC
ncbi:MAG: asparaginase [Zetaproteobacteria bacterium CG2_30_46_52]|nr:MAG: asparaginase [Zetaproteobacteria bacterium CG2_30_46_52]